jgi:membrane protein implicated in regulation of membrane protease activity
MQELLLNIGHWLWLIIAGVLLLLELAAPGVFFLWLALAATLTGIATFIVDFPWQIQIVLFATLSVILVLLVRPRLRSHGTPSDQPNLNQRMYNYVGRIYPLETDIRNGRGKVRIDDTLWDVEGPELSKGTRVRVARVEELRLVVEPA